MLVTDFFGSVHSVEMSNSSTIDITKEETVCRYKEILLHKVQLLQVTALLQDGWFENINFFFNSEILASLLRRCYLGSSLLPIHVLEMSV